MRARRDAAMRLLKVMMAASVAIPLAAFGYASWTAYHDAFFVPPLLDRREMYPSSSVPSRDLTIS